MEAKKGDRMKVIAGIPAYNNRRCIGGLVLGTEEYVDETIVVDCGSTDDTVKMAEDFGATVSTTRMTYQRFWRRLLMRKRIL